MQRWETEPLLIGHRLSGRWQEAYDLLEQVLADATGVDLGWAKGQLALTRYSQSPEHALSSLRLIDEAIGLLGKEPVELAKALMNGAAMARYALDAKRMDRYQHMMRRLLRLDSPELYPWQGRLLGSVGLSYQALGNTAKAAEYLRRTISFYNRCRGPYSEHDRECQRRIASTVLADLLLSKGDTLEAQLLTRGSNDNCSDGGLGYDLYLQGRLAASEGRSDEAVSSLTQAANLAERYSQRDLVLRARTALALVYFRSINPEKAEETLAPLYRMAARGRMFALLICLQRLKRAEAEREVVSS